VEKSLKFMNIYRKSVFTHKVRVEFDPKNKKHMTDFARFIKCNNWVEGCNYLLEDPYTDIPTMIYRKIAHNTLQSYMQ
jgi:hypothetical protein